MFNYFIWRNQVLSNFISYILNINIRQFYDCEKNEWNHEEVLDSKKPI
jgi:hypothetical protein